MIYAILITVVASILGGWVGYCIGYTRKADENKHDAAERTKELQSTYNNGIRVGKQQMLDELARVGLINEDAAEAIAGELH